MPRPHWKFSRLSVIACLLLAVVAYPAAARAEGLADDPRLTPTVTLGSGMRTLKQIVAELNRRNGRLQLTCEPELENEAAVIWVHNRPALEAMEALALAGQLGWKPTEGGYRLYARETPISPGTQTVSLQTLPDVPALAAKQAWPPAFPDVDEEELKRNLAAPEIDDYPAGSLGAALAQIGVKREISLAAVSPALRKQVRFPYPRPQGLPVIGADVLNRLTAKEGAAWSRVGACYTLVTPPKLVSLRRTPAADRQLTIKKDLDALVKSLTPSQMTRLNNKESLGFDQLEPEQLSLLGSIFRLTYSLIPAHDMEMVQNPKGWCLQVERTALILGLARGGRAPVLEREW